MDSNDIRSRKKKPGYVKCGGCNWYYPPKLMGEVYDIGRRPTIRRCDDCIWAQIRGLCKPDKAAELRAILHPPPGGRSRQETIDQEVISYE